MPSPTTAIDLITSSMRLAGILAANETPTADESQTALSVLNDLLEQWNTQRLTVYRVRNDAYTLTINDGVYTIGPSGDFNGLRPIQIQGGYTTINNIDYPLEVIDQDKYDNFAYKANGGIPYYICYNAGFPLGTIQLYPRPSVVSTLTIRYDMQFTALASISDSIIYPPGYAKALKYELGIELCAEFQTPVSPVVLKIMESAKADIKRMNIQLTEATFDAGLTGGRATNWRSPL